METEDLKNARRFTVWAIALSSNTLQTASILHIYGHDGADRRRTPTEVGLEDIVDVLDQPAIPTLSDEATAWLNSLKEKAEAERNAAQAAEERRELAAEQLRNQASADGKRKIVKKRKARRSTHDSDAEEDEDDDNVSEEPRRRRRSSASSPPPAAPAVELAQLQEKWMAHEEKVVAIAANMAVQMAAANNSQKPEFISSKNV